MNSTGAPVVHAAVDTSQETAALRDLAADDVNHIVALSARRTGRASVFRDDIPRFFAIAAGLSRNRSGGER
jgi:hypothetical protein